MYGKILLILDEKVQTFLPNMLVQNLESRELENSTTVKHLALPIAIVIYLGQGCNVESAFQIRSKNSMIAV